MSPVPLQITLNKLGTGQEAKENADILATEIVVSNSPLSLTEEACVFCQHPWNCQAHLLAVKEGRIPDPSQFLETYKTKLLSLKGGSIYLGRLLME